MQKIGIKLMHFPIFYDFMKLKKKLRKQNGASMENGGKVRK
jgi:hypothetical protein